MVDRKGKIVATNIEAVLEWRKKHDPEVYKAAIDGLIRVIAEAVVDDLLAEHAELQRTASGFAYFARYRLERGVVP